MKGYIPRIVETRLEESLQSRLITMIIGPRQVGKSTLMKYAEELIEKKTSVQKKEGGGVTFARNIFSYVLDDMQLRSAIKRDPRYLQKDIELSLGESLEKTGEDVYIFIDEVQKMPSLLEWIKQVFDENSTHIKFILSGSSAISMTRTTGETLAGRVEYINIYPFVYSELMHSRSDVEITFFEDIIEFLDQNSGGLVKGDSADDILAQITKDPSSKVDNAEAVIEYLNNKLPEYHSRLSKHAKESTACVVETLFYGGLPRVMTSRINDRIRMIKNYIEVYMEKEIGTLARNLDLELFGLSLQSFAQQSGDTLNINQVSKDVGISRPSLYKYLDLLENTYLVKKIHPYSSGGIDEESTKSVMMYFLDTGVLNNLTYVTSMQEMLRPQAFSRVVGSWLLGGILSTFSMLPQEPNLTYWQNYSGHKLDLIFERGDISFAFMLTEPKDSRRVKSTILKFAESSSKDTVIIFIPHFNAITMSLEYSIEEIEGVENKCVFTVRLPLQFLG